MEEEDGPQLFDFVVTAHVKEGGEEMETELDYRFPPRAYSTLGGKSSDKFLGSVLQFCFPDVDILKSSSSRDKCKQFSFVLTEVDGSRRFGYCIRFYTSCSAKYPVAVCIISFLPSVSLFSQILNTLMEYHMKSAEKIQIFSFLKSVQATPFPNPGENFQVRTVGSGTHTYTRPPDSDNMLEHLDTAVNVPSTISPHHLISIYASLLVERRLIFVSKDVSLLSDCVQTAVALLYPFQWQYVFIPVLPKSLLTFCCAPMPFVVGILANYLSDVMEMKEEEMISKAILFDLDRDKFIWPGHSEKDLKLIPAAACKQISDSLDELRGFKLLGFWSRAPKTDQSGLGRPFLEFISTLFALYRSYFEPIKGKDEEGRAVAFDRKEFVAGSEPQNQRLLTKFVQTQMFDQFILERERSPTLLKGSFDQKVLAMEAISSPRGTVAKNGETLNSGSNPPPQGRRHSIQSISYTPGLSAQEIHRVGWLTKRGAVITNWKKRFCVLDGHSLTYYENEEKRHHKKPKGSILITSQMMTRSCDEFPEHPHTLALVPPENERIYYISTENEADLHSWEKDIQGNINRLRSAEEKEKSQPQPPTLPPKPGTSVLVRRQVSVAPNRDASFNLDHKAKPSDEEARTIGGHSKTTNPAISTKYPPPRPQQQPVKGGPNPSRSRVQTMTQQIQSTNQPPKQAMTPILRTRGQTIAATPSTRTPPVPRASKPPPPHPIIDSSTPPTPTPLPRPATMYPLVHPKPPQNKPLTFPPPKPQAQSAPTTSGKGKPKFCMQCGFSLEKVPSFARSCPECLNRF